MLYVEYVTFALCSLTLVECSRMSRTMLNGALSEQYRNDVNKIDRPNTTPTVRAICTFASTDLNQALVLLRYYKNSPPISKSWIRACVATTRVWKRKFASRKAKKTNVAVQGQPKHFTAWPAPCFKNAAYRI